VKHSLERLDALVFEWLNPVNTPGLDALGVTKDSLIEEAAKECKLIRTKLLVKSVEIEKEEALLLLVQQCQAAIIRLLDKVFGYKLLQPDASIQHIYDAVTQHIRELLLYIESHYPKYFNKEEKVPDIFLIDYQATLKKELRILEKSHFTRIDSRLRQIISNHLQKHLQRNSEVTITYKKVAYIKELLSELRDLSATPEKATDLLMDLLIRMNFNTADLLNYYVDKLQVSIGACKTQAQKLEVLLLTFKKLKQLQLKPGVAFKPQMISLKEQVVGWISEEIYYLEKQQSFLGAASIQLHSIHEKDEDEKLHTALSVQQLAIFIRAARDTGMLTNKNQTALLKTIAKVFRTPYAETISAESLRIKYYMPEPGATQSVKDLLMEMFKKVQSY
jgi:hypothetical protein